MFINLIIMNHENTFHIICTFLQPLELVKCRYLSRSHHLWTDKWTDKHKTPFIDQICPKCANWVDKRDISRLSHFWDVYGDNKSVEMERITKVIQFLGSNTQRSFLFCEDCEFDEVYDLNTDFSYRGERIYYTLTMNDTMMNTWCVIFTQDRKKWNEYRCANIEFINGNEI